MKWLSLLLMKFWLVGSIVVYTPYVNCHVRSVWHTTQAEARNCMQLVACPHICWIYVWGACSCKRHLYCIK